MGAAAQSAAAAASKKALALRAAALPRNLALSGAPASDPTKAPRIADETTRPFFKNTHTRARAHTSCDGGDRVGRGKGRNTAPKYWLALH